MPSINLVVHLLALIGLGLLFRWSISLREDLLELQRVLAWSRPENYSHKRLGPVVRSPAHFLTRFCRATSVEFQTDSAWQQQANALAAIRPHVLCRLHTEFGIKRISIDASKIMYIELGGIGTFSDEDWDLCGLAISLAVSRIAVSTSNRMEA